MYKNVAAHNKNYYKFNNMNEAVQEYIKDKLRDEGDGLKIEEEMTPEFERAFYEYIGELTEREAQEFLFLCKTNMEQSLKLSPNFFLSRENLSLNYFEFEEEERKEYELLLVEFDLEIYLHNERIEIVVYDRELQKAYRPPYLFQRRRTKSNIYKI